MVYISLLGNPGCPDQLTNPASTDDEDYNRYRLYAIYVLPPTLRFLDSRFITRQERNDAERRGKYSRTVKFVPELSKFVQNPMDKFDDYFFNVNYTPLPTSIRDPLDHKGTIFFTLLSAFYYSYESVFFCGRITPIKLNSDIVLLTF